MYKRQGLAKDLAGPRAMLAEPGGMWHYGFLFAPALNRKSLTALFSTHPTLEQRLEQLARVSADLGRPV